MDIESLSNSQPDMGYNNSNDFRGNIFNGTEPLAAVVSVIGAGSGTFARPFRLGFEPTKAYATG